MLIDEVFGLSRVAAHLGFEHGGLELVLVWHLHVVDVTESVEDSVEKRFADEIWENAEFKTELHVLFEVHHESLVSKELEVLDNWFVKDGQKLYHVLLF